MGVMKTISAVNLVGDGHHESNEDQRVRNLVGDGHHESNEDQRVRNFARKWSS
ncbi:hypothetical protein KDJ21_025585 [Metabacillus litoralis]|uniref:hypothetical protein n=1 Tax=Metabacillus litoralis TaxID=152268 RepID=UPI001B98E3B5|nr:hypothetical protein [Metabacillus litoralis]UHA60046.1 hypothetical protein KDJ21_025585 [Metabacillus litoralis]